MATASQLEALAVLAQVPQSSWLAQQLERAGMGFPRLLVQLVH
jgi:hypothetical protein